MMSPHTEVHSAPSVQSASGALPERIGRLVVLERLGQGGMGVVYSAYDPRLDRKVAVKVLHEGTASAQMNARFTREAQTMAQLDHPNVVTIHDVGEYEGQLFISMAQVKGTTLREATEGMKLGWRRVVSLYIQAGRGLEAAHALGLIHRDFKPDNVLVDGDGRVLVTDFGLAKAHAQQAETHSSGTTLGGLTGSALLGTPAYMAAEQLLGEEITPRSDQFSFCVALWEALYGERPFRGEDLSTLSHEVNAGRIREPKRGPRVPRKMRQVIMRGLAREPAQRWPSMQSLLAALERDIWRPARITAFGLGAAAFVGLTTWSATKSENPCPPAVERLAGIWDESRSKEVEQALQRAGASFGETNAPRVRAELQAWTDDWTEHADAACQSARVQKVYSPQLFDRASACLERGRHRLEALVEVLADADPDVAMRASFAVASLPSPTLCTDLDALLADVTTPSDPGLARQVSDVHQQIAKAVALDDAGHFENARREAQDAVTHAQAIAHEPTLAAATLILGRALRDLGRLSEARAEFEASWHAGLRSRADESALASSINLLSLESNELMALDRARSWEDHALSLHARLRSSVTEEVHARNEAKLLRTRSGLALALADFESARALCERALKAHRELFGSEHPEVAIVLSTLAAIELQDGQLDAALTAATEARDIRIAALGSQHPDVAESLEAIGNVLGAKGDYARSQGLLAQALAMQREGLGPDHPRVARAGFNLGISFRDRGQLEPALKQFRQARAIWARAHGEDHPRIATADVSIANILADARKFEEAAEYYERALAARLRIYGADHPRVANVIANLATVEPHLGRLDEALIHQQQVLAIRRGFYGARHFHVGESLMNIGSLLHRLGELDAALRHEREALAIFEEQRGPHHPVIARILHNLSNLHHQQGQLEEAASLLIRALDIRRAAFGPEHPAEAEISVALAEVRIDQGRAQEALDRLEIAEKVLSAHGRDLIAADARFARARALWINGEGSAAHEQAHHAKRMYLEAGSETTPDIKKVDAWADEHPL